MPSLTPPADPDRFEEAIRAFRSRIAMTDPEFRELADEELDRAFYVANVSEANAVQEVMDAIDRAIEQGTTLEDFKAEVGDTLTEAWGVEDAPRMETVFRTNVMTAYNEGREEIFSDPAVREARPYKKVDGSGDSRECEICEPLDGLVLPADDPFWASHQFPLHPNCRCITQVLTPEEAAEEGVDTDVPEAEPPAEGFGTGEDYKPDLSGFDPEIAGILRDRFE